MLTEERMDPLVTAANVYLAEEAAKPRVDFDPLRQAVTEGRRREKSIAEFVLKYMDSHDMTTYLVRGDEARKEVAELERRLREAEAANADPPPPIKRDDVQLYLGDLRSLLEQSFEKSAKVMRILLGRVSVEAVPVKNRKRKLWIGHVNQDLVPLMAHAGRLLQTPDSGTWEFLCNRIWKFPVLAEVKLVAPPAYERMGPPYKALRDRGRSIGMIAAAERVSACSVRQAIRFAETGERPRGSGTKPTGRRRRGQPKYRVIADDVARLKDQRVSFPAIIAWLAEHRGITVGEATVRRGWNYAHPQAVREALEAGETPSGRKAYSVIPAEKHERVS